MIAIIDYDAGNIKSVEKAMLLLGQQVEITRDRERILCADKVILPGDASYASLLTNRLSQATVGCLMLAYSFSPRVHSIPRGHHIFARNDKSALHGSEQRALSRRRNMRCT